MYFRFYGWRHTCLWAKVARRCRLAKQQFTRSLGLGYKLCAVILVAGQRTHGTTFHALKVTCQVATPGAESAVYDCFVLISCDHFPRHKYSTPPLLLLLLAYCPLQQMRTPVDLSDGSKDLGTRPRPRPRTWPSRPRPRLRTWASRPRSDLTSNNFWKFIYLLKINISFILKYCFVLNTTLPGCFIIPLYLQLVLNDDI